jgi:hypothetical protein
VVARDETGRVCAYALALLRCTDPTRNDHVIHIFEEVLDTLEHRGRPLSRQRYYVMGQVCVDGPWRGKGTCVAGGLIDRAGAV